KLRELTPGDIRDHVFERFMSRRYQHEERRTSNALGFSIEELTRFFGVLTAQYADYNRHYMWTSPMTFTLADFERVAKNRERELIDLATRLNIMVQVNLDQYRFLHLLLRDYFAYNWAMKHVTADNHWHSRKVSSAMLDMIADARSIPTLI